MAFGSLTADAYQRRLCCFPRIFLIFDAGKLTFSPLPFLDRWDEPFIAGSQPPTTGSVPFMVGADQGIPFFTIPRGSGREKPGPMTCDTG